MAAAGVEKPVVSVEERKRPEPSEVERLICDATRLRTEVGWEPKVALDEGLKRTADWIARHMEQFDPENYRI